MIIYYDFKTQLFNIESSRNGLSKLTTWKPLSETKYLKDVSFGVVKHPFNPGITSFRRKTFTPYKSINNGGKDYGIAIKGTAITEDDYQNLIVDTNPIPITIRSLFYRYGDKLYQSYPNLIKYFKDKNLMNQATMNPTLTGARSVQAKRKFPTCKDYNYFIPRPVLAMQITPYSSNSGILFDEKQSAKSWVEWHTQLDENYLDIIAQRGAVA